MNRHIYSKFLPSKPWIRIGIQPKVLDPDPDSMTGGYWILKKCPRSKPNFSPLLVTDLCLVEEVLDHLEEARVLGLGNAA